MAITDWDHNAWYHRLLLRQVPPGAERVLEVGCGAGTLARRLADVVPHVDAVDRSPAMLAEAARAIPPNVVLHEADLRTVGLPDGGYDAVVSMSVLHHLAPAQALPRMARWVKPGGVLAAIALPRVDLPRDLPVELAAAASHYAMGLSFAAVEWRTGRRPFAFEPTHRAMPVRGPVLTTRELRVAAADLLPGVRVRRLVFRRYLLTWRKPV